MILGREFFDVNTLTVIASESYDDFAKALQKEVLESLSDRPKKITSQVLM
jgi:type III restriction enzyme